MKQRLRNKYTTSIEWRVGSSKKLIKLTNPYLILTKIGREKIQINKIRVEKGDITADTQNSGNHKDIL